MQAKTLVTFTDYCTIDMVLFNHIMQNDFVCLMRKDSNSSSVYLNDLWLVCISTSGLINWQILFREEITYPHSQLWAIRRESHFAKSSLKGLKSNCPEIFFLTGKEVGRCVAGQSPLSLCMIFIFFPFLPLSVYVFSFMKSWLLVCSSVTGSKVLYFFPQSVLFGIFFSCCQ